MLKRVPLSGVKILPGLFPDPVIGVQPFLCGDIKSCLLKSPLSRNEEAGIDFSRSGAALYRMSGSAAVEGQTAGSLQREASK